MVLAAAVWILLSTDCVAKEPYAGAAELLNCEFDESWDWSGVMGDLQLYYRLGRMMAASTSWPNWNDGDEFRAVRDESCKASEKGC